MISPFTRRWMQRRYGWNSQKYRSLNPHEGWTMPVWYWTLKDQRREDAMMREWMAEEAGRHPTEVEA